MESLAALANNSESPPARQSILGSFLRGRPRGVSQSHPSPPPPPPPHDTNHSLRESPPPNASPDAAGHRRRPAVIQASASQSLQPSPSIAGGAFSHMLRRRRSAGALASNSTNQTPQVVAVARTAAPAVGGTVNHNSNAPQHRLRLVPHLDSRRSLKFEPITRDVREGEQPLRIGRFTDRSGLGLAAANALGSNKLAFKSKVVSRAHAEIWVEAGGKFYIRDTKSSSGTFLNHVRLSAANTESPASELKDGDLLQLGVDYQGGTEDIYKCVKIKVEVGREWQSHSNPFNTNALNQLKQIAIAPVASTATKKPASAKTTLPDCCICLFAVTIQQALFIAPCSHAFHYKCIRPLLELHHPSFSCPLCRTFANLEEDVEVDIEVDEVSIAEASAVIASVAAQTTPAPSTPAVARGEHSRERPDAGAETEVEQDGHGSRLPASLRRRPVPSFPPTEAVDLTEDADEEMLDESALPALPEDGMDELQDDSRRVSPVSGGRSNRSAELLFEPDGEASGSGEADNGASGSDISGHGDAGMLHNKRKR
ncbi:hypothetical protein BDY19DRAFT_936529 [Irpex rosettiformis]|uniref:Uncharacterized protein n=1 Tax=Irpex rosettiformis TaxID=378272 RepID=A0ACB8U9M5_9APHY|nr:hypothetical protein BDY19DRAFT_936529 [Irpex rosettiformis]